MSVVKEKKNICFVFLSWGKRVVCEPDPICCPFKADFFWLNFNLSVLDIGECEVVVLGLFFPPSLKNSS